MRCDCKSLAHITSNTDVQQQLASLYDSVDDIDAIVGMLAEDHRPGSSTGETIATVLVDQFERLRDGDRLYYENSFTPAEITQIEATRLSDIIERNTTATTVQENVFTLMATPEAVADVATTEINDAISIDVLANDFDPEGDRLRVTRVGDPSQGRATIINGEIRYIPNVNFVGTDTFEYTIRDADGNRDTAQVDVTVTGVPVPNGTISGQVRIDLDRDGNWEDIEPGIAGVTMELFRDTNFDYVPDGQAIATTLTDAQGNYQFGDLAPGTYIVEQTNLEGYISTADINGFNLNRIAGIQINGNTISGQDFLDAPPLQNGSIRGQVRHDVDGDGDLSDTDAGIANVTLRVFRDINQDYVPDGEAIAIATTDADGNYSFETLANGTYIVEQTNLVGFISTADTNGFNLDRIGGLTINGNTLTGQDFLDTASDSAPNDIWGTEGGEQLWGTAGADNIFGRAGNDTLGGNNGDDGLFGAGGNDVLIGGAGNDVLAGTDGTLQGNGERDSFVGGDGADTFVLGDGDRPFYSAQNYGDFAWINDFDDSQDNVQLWGMPDQYETKVINGNTELFRRAAGNSSTEVIAYFAGNTNIDLNSRAFEYITPQE